MQDVILTLSPETFYYFAGQTSKLCASPYVDWSLTTFSSQAMW